MAISLWSIRHEHVVKAKLMREERMAAREA
jgi:hypothetical protein